MTFVDASAIVAMLTDEADANILAHALESAGTPITSSIAVFEATLGLCRKRHASFAEALADVTDLPVLGAVETVGITERDGATALDAFARYGKERGHPAQLNLGDCFAYAVAKNRHAAMLFKGEDFNKTDIESAVPHG